MTSPWLTLALAVIGSSAVFGFIQFMITRHDKKKENNTDERLKKLEEKAEKNEVDNVRLQLLFLIAFYPDQSLEILKCAQHYFKDLNGDWYMTAIFSKWLLKNNIAKPEWFSGESEK